MRVLFAIAIFDSLCQIVDHRFRRRRIILITRTPRHKQILGKPENIVMQRHFTRFNAQPFDQWS